ncbi:MAG: hypothetical protein RSB99_02210 [Bacilli bacterium]
MALLDSLISNRNQIMALKEQVNLVLINLNQSISSVEPASNKIGTYFNIDATSADNGKLLNLKNTLIAKRDHITNAVLPAIQGTIGSINQQIANEEEAIRQRERAIEEARQEAARQEAARQEAAKEEAARQEAARQAAARKSSSKKKNKWW